MYCCRMPPPQVKKIVGALPAPIASWIFCLKDWFSTKSMVIFSPRWLFSNLETRFWTAVLAGLGPVVTSHIVAVPELLLEFLPLPAEEPQAASARAAAAAAPTVSHRRRAARVSPMYPPDRFRIVLPAITRNLLETFRKTPVILEIPQEGGQPSKGTLKLQKDHIV